MADLPEQVYRDAAAAMVAIDQDGALLGTGKPQPWPSRAVRAAVESAYRAGWRDAGALLDRETGRVRDKDWPGKVGIEYVQGVEHAAIMLERHLDHVGAHHEDRTYTEIADVKRGEDR